MPGTRFFIPHGVLDGIFMGYVNAMKLPGLGGKLNGKLVAHRGELADAIEDSNAARTLISQEFTRREPNEKGEMIPVKVPKRDRASGDILYRKDPDGNRVYEMQKGELVPVPEYDDNAVALTDTEAFMREFNALMEEDILIEIQPLTDAELLIIQGKGTAEHANALRPLAENSKYLKPREEREKLARERQEKNPALARLMARKAEREAREKAQVIQEHAATDRGALDEGPVAAEAPEQEEPVLSAAELDGTIEPEPSEQSQGAPPTQA